MFTFPEKCFNHPMVGHLIRKNDQGQYVQYVICFVVVNCREYHQLVSDGADWSLVPENESYVMGLWENNPDTAIKNFEEWDEDITRHFGGNYLSDCEIVK